MEARLDGRTCMITGATSGIGRAAAIELARRGARLVLVCRDAARGEETRGEIEKRTGNTDVELMHADLASLGQVRALAERFLSEQRPLHVLLNNAGVVNLRRELTEDGFEATFAVNHLAVFALSGLLLPRLLESAPARIVTVASDAHRGVGRMPLDDLQSEQRYGVMRVYGASKLANILFTRELARRLPGADVTANALHPGMVGTRLATNNGVLARLVWALVRPFSRTPERGAETAVHLCASPEVAGATGGYYFDRKPHEPTEAALHDGDARELWEVSERLTGVVPVTGASDAGQ